MEDLQSPVYYPRETPVNRSDVSQLRDILDDILGFYRNCLAASRKRSVPDGEASAKSFIERCIMFMERVRLGPSFYDQDKETIAADVVVLSKRLEELTSELAGLQEEALELQSEVAREITEITSSKLNELNNPLGHPTQ